MQALYIYIYPPPTRVRLEGRVHAVCMAVTGQLATEGDRQVGLGHCVQKELIAACCETTCAKLSKHYINNKCLRYFGTAC